jgi:hypothetical protein
MLESEIIPQSYVDNLDSHRNELPTFITDVCLVAASSNVIVVSQINIEAQFLGNWFEGVCFPKSFALSRICTIHGSDFES